MDKELDFKGRVLVVDDQETNVKLLDTILTRRGFYVHKAYCGQEALDAASSANVDVILLDIMMPDMDGYETCKQLKANPKTVEIPVIFVTSMSDISDKINAFARGGVDYVTKPFHTEEIVSRAETHIKIYRLQRSLEKTQEELRTLNHLLNQYNDKLEDTVRQRTQELVMTNKRLETSLKDKEILIKEVHHRVRNNLQIISSMLSLGLSNITNAEFASIFRSSFTRVKVLSIIHDKLCDSTDFASVNINDFINVLFSELASASGGIPTLTIVSNIVALDINSMISCGLILNELISNSIKHAFDKGSPGMMTVTLNRNGDGDFTMSVSDNGKGIPQAAAGSGSYCGLQIVRDLVQSKLKGRMSVNVENGTKVTITFRETGGRYHNII